MLYFMRKYVFACVACMLVVLYYIGATKELKGLHEAIFFITGRDKDDGTFIETTIEEIPEEEESPEDWYIPQLPKEADTRWEIE